MRIFKEEQRFTQWWLWLLIAAIMGIPIYGITQQLILKKPFGDNPMSNEGLIVFSIGMFLFLVFFLSLKLKTRIDETGVHFQFFPFHLKQKTINWHQVKNIYTRKYLPISEYGGWGIKGSSLGRKKNGIAYNTSGDIGIQLELKSGKRILIGTQKLNDANSVLKNYENKIHTNEV